jgi:hypothetical protein
LALATRSVLAYYRHAELHFLDIQTARLYFGKVQYVVDDGQEGIGRPVNVLCVVSLLLIELDI